jgi:hypothetical protein
VSIARHAGGSVERVSAVEVLAKDGRYVFDIRFIDANDCVVEDWRGAQFAAIDVIEHDVLLRAAPALRAVYLERLGRELLNDPDLHLSISPAQNVIDAHERRGDGRPLGEGGVSVAYNAAFSMMARSTRLLGCDVESADAVDVRNWVVAEALRKLGRRAPHSFAPIEAAPWAPRSAAIYITADGVRVMTVCVPGAVDALISVAGEPAR